MRIVLFVLEKQTGMYPDNIVDIRTTKRMLGAFLIGPKIIGNRNLYRATSKDIMMKYVTP